MNAKPFISILIAEDNDVSRQLMTGILEAQGYKVHGAIDGESAIKVVHERQPDIALVDVNMAPTGGLEFAKYLVSKSIDLPVVLVTGDDSVDLLTQASALGILKVLQKPVEPNRLIQTVERVAKRRGLSVAPLAVEQRDVAHNSGDLMLKTIKMAQDNVKSGKGGPYAAILADESGKIIGSGMNRHAARIDPISHAEVMAIRQAAEKLGTADLKDYVLYCSGYPTKIGQALIESVGIEKVYYGLTHEETGLSQKETNPTHYEQLAKDEALKLFS